MSSLDKETSRRYSIYEKNQHISDFRTSISGSNVKNGVDSFLGRSHEYNRELYSATELSNVSDEFFIEKYQSYLEDSGSLDSSTKNWNPDFPDGTIVLDFMHPNAPNAEWNKDQLHKAMPIDINIKLKDNPYRGHPNLQVQPLNNQDPSAIFDLNNEWVPAKVGGILPQINPEKDGAYGVYDATRNEIKSSRDSIGKYFTKVYNSTTGLNSKDVIKDPRILGKSTI